MAPLPYSNMTQARGEVRKQCLYHNGCICLTHQRFKMFRYLRILSVKSFFQNSPQNEVAWIEVWGVRGPIHANACLSGIIQSNGNGNAWLQNIKQNVLEFLSLYPCLVSERDSMHLSKI